MLLHYERQGAASFTYSLPARREVLRQLMQERNKRIQIPASIVVPTARSPRSIAGVTAALRITGNPCWPAPMTSTLAFGDSASCSPLVTHCDEALQIAWLAVPKHTAIEAC